MASKPLSFLPLLLLLLASAASAAGPVNITGNRDITAVLSQFPNFSTLNKLLTQTKVAADINSRQTLTVFVVADSAMSPVTSLPSDVLQKVLSLHVVLDYYDVNKISNLPNATGELTTLFQASGKAGGKAGFINATDVGDGQIQLGSAVDNKLTSSVIREIAMQPYNLSVIEISQMIIPPGIASSGAGGSSNGSSSSGGSSGAATPTPAPKADATEAPKAGPVSPKAAPVPSGSSSAPKSSSSGETPAPATSEAPAGSATDAPVGSATDAPNGEAPVGSATDAPNGEAPVGSATDGPAADKKASSASRLLVGVGIGAAMGAAFLAAL